MRPAARRLRDHGEQVAADTVHFRLDDAHHRVGGDRRVDGVAAPFEDLDPGAGGERLAGRDNAKLSGDFRSAGDHGHESES